MWWRQAHALSCTPSTRCSVAPPLHVGPTSLDGSRSQPVPTTKAMGRDLHEHGVQPARAPRASSVRSPSRRCCRRRRCRQRRPGDPASARAAQGTRSSPRSPTGCRRRTRLGQGAAVPGRRCCRRQGPAHARRRDRDARARRREPDRRCWPSGGCVQAARPASPQSRMARAEVDARGGLGQALPDPARALQRRRCSPCTTSTRASPCAPTPAG